jgi:hypothetical protein
MFYRSREAMLNVDIVRQHQVCSLNRVSCRNPVTRRLDTDNPTILLSFIDNVPLKKMFKIQTIFKALPLPYVRFSTSNTGFYIVNPFLSAYFRIGIKFFQ